MPLLPTILGPLDESSNAPSRPTYASARDSSARQAPFSISASSSGKSLATIPQDVSEMTSDETRSGNMSAVSSNGYRSTNKETDPASIGRVKPNNYGHGTANAILGMVRKGTRRDRHTDLPFTVAAVPDVPLSADSANTLAPVSSGSDLAQETLGGAGKSVGERPWQEYRRAPPSFSGTTKSIETRVTTGHSDADTIMGSPRAYSEDLSADHREMSVSPSAHTPSIQSMYDRDLPSPPFGQSAAHTPVIDKYGTMKTNGLTSPEASQISPGEGDSEDPYDGLADDGSDSYLQSDSSPIKEPSDPSVAEATSYTDFPAKSSLMPEIRMFPVGHTTSAHPKGHLAVDSATLSSVKDARRMGNTFTTNKDMHIHKRSNSIQYILS